MADFGRRKGDEALLLALASGKSIRDAAHAAAIGERTATRRLADPAFRLRIAQARAAMLDRALGTITDTMTEAASTLRSLLHAEAESVRLQACKAIVELGLRLQESVALEERLAALEQRANAQQSKDTAA